MLSWKKLSAKNKENYLNPKKAVIDHPKLQLLATKKAEQYREKYKYSYINIPYGRRKKQKLDIFVPKNFKNCAVQVYFHGGYWIARDKFDHSHLAKPAVENKIIHVSVNYDLCPEVTLNIIVKEAQECVEWIFKNIKTYGGNPNNINLVGHSAGAHLVAMILTKKYTKLPSNIIKSAVLISGIYQPEITRYISINSIIKLSKKNAEKTNVYNYNIINKTKALVVVGSLEPAAWISLSKNILKWLDLNKVEYNFLLAKNLNHFTIIRELSIKNSKIAKKVIAMIEK